MNRHAEPTGGPGDDGPRGVGTRTDAPNPEARRALAAVAAVLCAVSGTAMSESGEVGELARCSATATELTAARDAFAATCPTLPRLDCDLVDGRWICASWRIGSHAPARAAPPAVASAAPPPAVPPSATVSSPAPYDGTGPVGPAGAAGPTAFFPELMPANDPDVLRAATLEIASEAAVPVYEDDPGCDWTGATLDAAREGYALACTAPRVDCDPVEGGWLCASVRIGAHAPGYPSDPIVVATAPPDSFPEPSVPEAVSAAVPVAAPAAVADTTPASVPPPAPAPEPAAVPVGELVVEPEPIPEIELEIEPEPEPVIEPEVEPTGYDGRYGEPNGGWADSYSVDGACYVSTSGDHGVYALSVDTPAGRLSVGDAIGLIEPGPGIGRADALYNDIRCGRGPANENGDEDPGQCPGRVDRGRAGCTVRGPDWRFR